MKVALVLVLCMGHLTLGANPNYSYHIKIDDAAHGNFQEKAEARKGPDAQGFYSVVEPNGALRTVQYTADDRGFNPIVTYSYGHPGASTAVFSSQGSLSSTYAPAFVSDKRVQIVDKYIGAPPALNIQPFALPAPSLGISAAPSPIVVPAPLRAAPAPELIAQALNVNYAPAYMPPVTAFVQPQRTYLPPPPVAQVAVAPPQVLYQEAPQPTFVAQPQQVYYQAPPAQVVAPIPQPQLVYQAPKRVIAPQIVKQTKIISVEKAPVQLLDSYAVAPVNTVTNLNAPVYPDAIKAVKKPVEVYGPPDFTPGEPISLSPPPTVVKVVQKAQPVKVVQQAVAVPVAPPQPIVQYAPQVQYVQPPPVVKYIQPQPQYIAPAPAPVKYVQPQVAAPVVGLYAGAIGYHTQNSNSNAYLHSYGTQGFQVTSSRQFNKAVLPYPVVQKQVQVEQYVQPQAQLVQETYAPQYLPPAPVRQVVQAAPVIHQQPLPVYGAPAAKLVQPAPAPLAVVGKKQNPLTFAYSYDQGAAKVSHSYSGSGW
jgi:hypothetical protein